MITLKFHFSSPFNEVTKIINTHMNFDKELTLNELFEFLYDKYGEKFNDLLWDKKNKENFSSFLSLIINGRAYRDENFVNTVLKDGDDISFLYIYFGG